MLRSFAWAAQLDRASAAGVRMVAQWFEAYVPYVIVNGAGQATGAASGARALLAQLPLCASPRTVLNFLLSPAINP